MGRGFPEHDGEGWFHGGKERILQMLYFHTKTSTFFKTCSNGEEGLKWTEM